MTTHSRTTLPQHAIAVVGMVGRFPGSPDVQSLWANIMAGREGISFFRDDELDPLISNLVRQDPAYVKAKGVMADCDKFDAGFFGISPLEAQVMDPQHRVLLELAWAALENSGHRPSDCGGRMGVFVGANWDRYRTINVSTQPDVIARFGEFNTALANSPDFLATRISYKLNLKGPACTVSTACSTSLVAIAQAARALANGECELALAGGVSVSVPVNAGYLYEVGGMLSKDGHCRPFDAECTGTTFNDGAGIVVLRRLSDAIADGDNIHAVIRGFAVNNDGADKVSFTAPSVVGQADVLSSALKHAGVDPATVGYIETHGTATPLGDPIEFAALLRAYEGLNVAGRACAIGSVKSAVGHLIHAAGVTGFIMAVMAVQKGIIPPTMFFRAPNPRLQMDRSRFYVPVTPQKWVDSDVPRRAGVSSFGVGGTNAHIVIEQAPVLLPSDVPGQGLEVLCVSAKTEVALGRQIDALADFVRAPAMEFTLPQLAWNLQNGREAMRHRAAVAVATLAEGAAALGGNASMRFGDGVRPRRIAFLFPGHGSQRTGMGRGLYERSSVFRRCIDAGIECLRSLGGPDILPTLLGGVQVSSNAPEDLRLSHPALFLCEYALATTLEALGLVAETLIGCSLGEFAGAVLAGVMSLEDAMRVVMASANAVSKTPPGSMLSVFCSESEAREAATGDVAVAAVHGADIVVLSGSPGAIEETQRVLARRRVSSLPLAAGHAFHSPMVDSVTAVLETALESAQLSAPNRRIVSSVTGLDLTAEEATSPTYWASILRKPIRFGEALDSLGEGRDYVVVEVGPGSALTALAIQHPNTRMAVPIAAQPSMGSSAAANRELHSVVAHCWVNGGEVDFGQRWGGLRPGRLQLPTYCFERTRYWLDAQQVVRSVPTVPVLAAVSASAGVPIAASSGGIAARMAKALNGACGLDVDPASSSQWAELGFDSLVITQLAISIRREFGIELGFRDLMELHTTPHALQQWLLTRMPEQVRTGQAAAVAPEATGQTTLEGSEVPVRRPNPGARIERRVADAFQLDPAQQAYLNEFLVAYANRTRSSKAFAQRHRHHLSDPRTVSGFHPLWKEIVYPIVTERSSGSRLWDLDGNEYIDFLNGFGSIFFGHSPQFLTDAVRDQLAKGIEVGPQTALAGEVAELFCQLTGNERVAFSNTGSEAVAGALRVARTVTGRDKVVMFEGAYHGIFDEVVVRSGPNGLALAGSPGIPRSHTCEVVLLAYGTDQSLREIARLGRELAAVLVEPVQSRRPELQPVEFLKKLREITAANGTALILDEVVTGFRTHPGGIQALFGVRADMAIYGKVVGGGHSIGLIGGRKEFLDALDGGQWQFGDDSVPEVGVTFFAGTFVRHPVALASARAVLRRLVEAGPSLQVDLGRRTSAMVSEIKSFLARVGAKVKIESFQSVMYISAAPSEIWASLFFAKMRYHGIHVGDHFPCFLTTSHSDEDIAHFKTTFCKIVSELVEHGFLTGKSQRPDTASPDDPPVAGARLGRRPDGTLAWFVPDPDRPGKFREVVSTKNGRATK